MTELNGDWLVEITFIQGQARHAMRLEQDGDTLSGTYRSQYGTQLVRGQLKNNTVQWGVGISYQHCGAQYRFSGTVDGNTMQGVVGLGEFWQGEWSAKRVV